MSKLDLDRVAELRPALWKTEKHKRKCQVCLYWIHKEVESCQPCIGSKPAYSMKHQFRKLAKP